MIVFQIVDIEFALPPLRDWVFDPVLLSPDEVWVPLFVEVELLPVSPPRAPLPPEVVDPLWTPPPLPPLPVEPELPEPEFDIELLVPDPFPEPPEPLPHGPLPEPLPVPLSLHPHPWFCCCGCPLLLLADDWLPPVEPELPEAAPLPALLLFSLLASPPLPPDPPLPVVVFDVFELDPSADELPPFVVDCAVELPPIADSIDEIDPIEGAVPGDVGTVVALAPVWVSNQHPAAPTAMAAARVCHVPCIVDLRI